MTNIIYQELPTKKIIELAKGEDYEACMELSDRYKTGTPLLEKNLVLSEYWMNRAKDISGGKDPGPIQVETPFDTKKTSAFSTGEEDGNADEAFSSLCNGLKRLGLDNNYDRFVYPNVSQEQKNALQIYFRLGDDELIAYYRIITADQSMPEKLIITNNGIHYRRYVQYWGFGWIKADVNAKPKSELTFLWGEFDKVTFNPDDKRFYFFSNNEQVGYLGRSYLIKKESTDMCIQFAKLLTDTASMYRSKSNTIDSIMELHNNGNSEEALSKLKNLIQNTKEQDDLCILYYLQGRILLESIPEDNEDVKQEHAKEALSCLQSSLRLMTHENKDWLPYINSKMGMALVYLGDISCRDYFIKSLDTDDPNDEDLVKDNLEYLDALEKELTDSDGMWQEYAEDVDYKDRQYLMVTSNLKGCYDQLIKVFRKQYMPNVKFPIGHPQIGTLYVAHPYRKGLYLPYSESKDTFFMEKIHELCYLVQCLGATEIDISKISGKDISEMNNSSLNIEGEVGIKVQSGGASYSKTENNEYKHSNNKNIGLRQTFNPTKKPYVPKDLIWFDHMPNWKQLANSRLHGDILEYTETVSSSENTSGSKNVSGEIAAHFKNLIVSINANVKGNYSTSLTESQNTEWKVEVHFKSTKLLNEDSNSSSGETMNDKSANKQSEALTENEAKYLDEVKFCLEDSTVIDAPARKFLDRLCKRYEITPERAAEIEEMAQPKLTDDEAEYVDAIKDALKEGEISPRVRKLLNRLRDSLDISEERAQELEKSIS